MLLSTIKKSFHLYELIDDCCQHIRSEGVFTITTEGPDLSVYADPDKIEQVVANFTNNAMKYAPESKEMHISIVKSDHLAKVSLTDHGPGIPSEKLPFLFDRYFRADSTGQSSGLGLGLYICSEIIKHHDGRIGVISEMGKGSTFWFTLPLA